MSDARIYKGRKILFTGAESTGKTTCSSWLGSVTGWPVVAEEARSYLTLHGPAYSEEDVLTLAELQWQAEHHVRSCNDNVICDTDMLTFVVWLQHKFDIRHEIIWQRCLHHQPDICFLCMPDIPWEPDPLREHPYDRERLTQSYIDLLNEIGIQPVLLFGSLSERQQTILEVLRR